MNDRIDSALSRYMSRVSGLPRLSREEEQAMWQKWEETRDPRLTEQLVRSHLRFVVTIAMKYRRYGLPLSELIAEGNFGIVHALRKYDSARGTRFVTYAAYWIRAYILNYIIGSWSLVGVGSGVLRSKMFFKLRREKVRVTNLVGEGEEADELLARRFNLPREEIVAMVRRLESRDVSLDARVHDDGHSSLVDTLASPTSGDDHLLASEQISQQIRDVVQLAITSLDARERYIVESRLMADSEDEVSLAEIGRKLGVSRERARQLEARTKKKLRERIVKLSGQSEAELAAISSAA